MQLKRNLMLVAISLSTLAVSAQNTQSSGQVTEEGKTAFKPHWYMQVQAGAAQTVGEASFKDLISPTAALSVGYKFNPLWGIRAGVSGWQAKGK